MGYRNAIFPPVKSSCLVSAEDADYEIQSQYDDLHATSATHIGFATSAAFEIWSWPL